MSEIIKNMLNFNVGPYTFLVKRRTWDDSVQLELQCDVDFPDFTGKDPIESLIKSGINTYYDSNKKQPVTDSSRVLGSVLYKVTNSIAEFYTNYAPLKAVSKSETYKWLDGLRYSAHRKPETNDCLIMLFRYIESFKEETNLTLLKTHRKNVITILDLLREHNGC